MQRKFLALIAVFLIGGAHPALAQQPTASKQNVISANPFGLLIDLFNAEYERVVSASSTAGFGGSTYQFEDNRYINVDGFWRFYPSGRPLDGWTFGVKAGITTLTDTGTHFGYGFDANRSWLLGPHENFYVGIGFGLKRLLGASAEDDFPMYVPTFRIVNIGLAF